MSRQHKFRAWDEKTETMFYSDKDYGECTFVCESEGYLKCYVPEEVPATLDEPSYVRGREIFEIMEFTGLRDKNGQDIYEGDIVLAPAMASTGLTNYGGKFAPKVIGNIYEKSGQPPSEDENDRLTAENKALAERIEKLETYMKRAIARFKDADEHKPKGTGFPRGSVGWAMCDDLEQAIQEGRKP